MLLEEVSEPEVCRKGQQVARTKRADAWLRSGVLDPKMCPSASGRSFTKDSKCVLFEAGPMHYQPRAHKPCVAFLPGKVHSLL